MSYNATGNSAGRRIATLLDAMLLIDEPLISEKEALFEILTPSTSTAVPKEENRDRTDFLVSLFSACYFNLYLLF